MSKKFFILLSTVFLLIGASSFYYDKYFEITKNIEIFANVYKEINNNFVDETNPSKLMKVGIDAMLASLDPFTNYISEAQIENYRLTVEGKYNGIGAKAKKMGDHLTITEVFKDYPAYKAGLRAGDQILKVNNQDAKGKDSEDLNHIMRGIPKSEVDVEILRPGSSQSQKFTIIRDEVNIPNVPYSSMLRDSIAYISLTTFTDNAGKNVQDALRKLKAENANIKGVILDLRDNGGGLLHEAVNVCNTFVPAGQTIASTRSKQKEKDMTYKTQMNPVDESIPVAVLINKNSASASEIVSGTLQDLDRAVILGQISYGKGLVQNTRDVGYNAIVKLTIAKYYIPSGRCIQSVKYENGEVVHLPDSLRTLFKTKNGRPVYDGGGIKPDIEVPEANFPEIVQKIVDQDFIFNYVTHYLLKNSAPEKPENFEFNQFNDFVDYLKQNKFDDKSDAESKWADFEKELKKSGQSSLITQTQTIKNNLDQLQWLQIQDNKDLISNLIEEEIASRTGYESGRYAKRLGQDKLVAEAISTLLSNEKMKSILHTP